MPDEQELPTQEEINTALGTSESVEGSPEVKMFETPEERAIAMRLIPVLTAKATKAAQERAEAEKAKILKETIDGLIEENRKIIEGKVAELQKSLTPPTPEELQTILNQEYAEFTLQLRSHGDLKHFTIRELPMSAETRVLNAVRKTLKERLKDIALFDWQTTAANTLAERVIKIAELVPGAMETMADCAAVILDPLGKDPQITGKWVLENISIARLSNIVMAQLEVGRYRDFLSRVGSLIPGMTMR